MRSQTPSSPRLTKIWLVVTKYPISSLSKHGHLIQIVASGVLVASPIEPVQARRRYSAPVGMIRPLSSLESVDSFLSVVATPFDIKM